MADILAFTDTETTHLSTTLGEVWEVGVVHRTATQRTEDARWMEDLYDAIPVPGVPV
jgi:hypothetical protein